VSDPACSLLFGRTDRREGILVRTQAYEQAAGGLVSELTDELATCHDVPRETACWAAGVTARRFAGEDVAPARVRAYLWAVVRRRALGSSGAGARLRDRYLAAALAEDLRAGGHARDRVREELATAFGASLPWDVIERLSAGGGRGV
jgi:hypothetical protein